MYMGLNFKLNAPLRLEIRNAAGRTGEGFLVGRSPPGQTAADPAFHLCPPRNPIRGRSNSHALLAALVTARPRSLPARARRRPARLPLPEGG